MLATSTRAQTTVDETVKLDKYVVYGREINFVGEAQSAAQGEVGMADLANWPLARRGELLESVPGVIVTQHSGDGKANQYFLRGFNLDHGTDFATTVDGMPVNFRSHAHGQGYSDINFVIPELVEKIDYQKGCYFPANGDFSAAGAAQFRLVDSLPRGELKVEGGDYEYGRAVIADKFHESAEAISTFAFEGGYNNGPWVSPENAHHFTGMARQCFCNSDGQLAITALDYHAQWNSTDQIPQRAIDEGLVSRFGAIDPSDGGATDRASLSLNWSHEGTDATTRVDLYGIYYRLNLFSDFTFFLDDPVNGDQFNQRDRRGVFGGSATHEWNNEWAGKKVVNTFGLQTQADTIRLGLNHSQDRQILDVIRSDSVHEDSGAAFFQSEMRATDWLRATVGAREDVYRFDVSSDNALNSGTRTADIFSPKAGLVFGPWEKTEIYLDAGEGFHSNDARGVVQHVDPQTGDAVEPASPLARARGAEVGVRTAAVHGLVSTVSLWALDLDSELVFEGDSGTTSINGPARRYGVEFSNFYRLARWLTLNGDVSLTKAYYRDETNGGRDIPNSIGTVATGGVNVNFLHGWFGAVRLRYFGRQPLVEDGSVWEPASVTVNARAGWQNHTWEVAFDVLNVFNRANDDIAYFYTSRLPGEPLAGVDDVHFHPAEPREFRASVTRKF